MLRKGPKQSGANNRRRVERGERGEREGDRRQTTYPDDAEDSRQKQSDIFNVVYGSTEIIPDDDIDLSSEEKGSDRGSDRAYPLPLPVPMRPSSLGTVRLPSAAVSLAMYHCRLR